MISLSFSPQLSHASGDHGLCREKWCGLSCSSPGFAARCHCQHGRHGTVRGGSCVVRSTDAGNHPGSDTDFHHEV